MQIIKLQVHRLRNIHELEIVPGAKLNLIIGDNGSGKTSLLEAIHVLGTGKSFRESSQRNLIQQGCDEAVLFCEIDEAGHRKSLGVQKAKHHSQIKLNGERLQQNSELAQHLPLQLIHPESQALVDGGPAEKRRFLDWGMFHVEPSFMPLWKSFRQILKQRNAALLQGLRQDLVTVWDQAFVEKAQAIHELRHHYLQGLRPHIQRLLQQLMDLEHVDIQYHPGWDESESLARQLKQAWDRDRHVQHTTLGPHRADLPIWVQHVPVHKWLSRGQQKLFAATLLLAQLDYLRAERDRDCLLLVDDLPAELDDDNRLRFLNVVRQHQVQTFITATHEEMLLADNQDKRFHVKHGCLE